MAQTQAFLASLKDKNVWIAGAARSGLGAASILKKLGARVFVTDFGKISPEIKQSLETMGIGFEENGHSLDRFVRECDLLVLSPAILLTKSIAWEAKQHRIPTVSEIEVASWVTPAEATVIGITGTNGKSTVTNYLAQLFALADRRAVPCGNFGLPFSVAVEDSRNYNLYSLELSSYQLETTYSLRPKATLLLNLQKDHLPRYVTMDEYLKAKWRLVLLTADDGIAAIDIGAFRHAMKLGLPLPRAKVVLLNTTWPEAKPGSEELLNKFDFAKTLPLSLYGDLATQEPATLLAHTAPGYANYVAHSDGSAEVTFYWKHHKLTRTLQEPCIPGEHNIQNLLAANCIALHLGISPEIVFAQWEKKSSKYIHVPHRMEVVGGENRVFVSADGAPKTLTVVNDSKATNVESLLVALRSYRKPVRLLVGGDPKGESFSPMAQHAHNPVIKFYPFGKAGHEIQQTLASLGDCVAQPVPSLFDAATLALQEANDGEIVLLSPACASFDEFKNFEHRGDMFREWAMQRLSPSSS